MDVKKEKDVLSTLYTRLYEAITVTPATGAQAPFDKKTTFIQLAKNQAINPDDFKNAASPANPKGSFISAETFSLYVDDIPAIGAEYIPTGNHVSGVYKNIVDGANSSAKEDPKQLERYNKAFKFLNVKTTITDMDDNKIVQINPTAMYAKYLSNQQSYIAAVSGYRTAFLSYDMDKISDQREWQAKEPMLKNLVNQTYNTWRAQGADQIEQALGVMAASINSSVDNAIREARQTVAAQNQLPTKVDGGRPWYLSYAMPSNWYDPSAVANFSDLTIKSSYLNEEEDSTFHQWGAEASWKGGLWSVGGETKGEIKNSNYHMNGSDISISAKIGVVRIFRPWMDEFIFRMNNWYINGKGKHGISNGQLDGNSDSMLPLIPTAFIVARDIQISGSFSTEDKTHIEKAISGKTSVGWGPFSLSGSYSYKESKDTFNSTFDGNTITVPGIQVIAWVSQITPASAPEDAPVSVKSGAVVS